MKVLQKGCKACGGTLMWEREENSNELILKCQLCGRPHSTNGELIVPKLGSGRVSNAGKK